MDPIATLPSGCFSGSPSRARSIAGLTLTELSYSAGTEIPTHAHELPYFSLVLRGSYSERFGHLVRETQALDIIFHPAGEPQSQVFHPGGARCLAIELGPPFIARFGDYLRLLEGRGGFVTGHPASLVAAVHEEFRSRDEVSSLAIEAAALELIVAAVRDRRTLEDRQVPSWIATVEQLLRERFTEHLTLNDISAFVGVHPALVARSFRKFRGMSIAHFLRQQRIEFAWRRLAKTDLPLSQIALEAGFCDQSHFSRVFKKITGMRPNQFQARTRIS